jgi:CheY-like chemotaxis protein
VILSAASTPAGGKRNIRLSVKDTGIGIPEEKRAGLFQKFYQAESSTTRKFGGTGLGLAIVKDLTGIMGGSVAVESEEGKGSTFIIEIPLVVDSSVAAQWPTCPHSNNRVAIVDANPVSRSALIESLSSWGISATACRNSSEALEFIERSAAESRPVEVIIRDNNICGDSCKLRSPGNGCVMRSVSGAMMVALSSVRERLDGEELSSDSLQGYLVKPVKRSRLFSAVCDALARARGISAASSEMAASVQRTRDSFAGAKVLVAEDNVVNQKLATKVFQKLGCSVTVASNGEEAIAAVASGDHDIVFMDVQMPVMDGFVATRGIRALGGEKGKIPIVAMTANAMQGDKEQCLAAGMDDYVAKPISFEEVKRALSIHTTEK